MTDADPTSDMFALLGLPNPLSGLMRTAEQFRRGVDEMLTTMARFNDTLDQLNGVARRVNGFLDEIEEPMKAAMPQVTRTVKAADAITQQLSAPIERLTPSLVRLAEVLGNPSIGRLPGDLVSVVDSLGELTRRLQPLTQMAETAGSMFGLRSLGGFLPRGSERGGSGGSTSPPPPTPAPAKKAPAKKAAPQKASTKTSTTTRKPASKKAASTSRSATPRAPRTSG